MMEPLLDEQDRDLETALLRAGRDVELSSASRAKLLTALGVSASLTFGSKLAAAAGLFGKLSASKGSLIGSLAAAGAVGAGVYYSASTASYHDERPVIAVQGTDRTATNSVTHNVPPREPALSALREARGPEKSSSAPAAVEPEVSREPAKAAGAPQAIKPRAASKTSNRASLGDELALVESASRATKMGNAGLALQQLAEYQRRFPRGKLALEAQVIRIEALARAGRRAEAQRIARSFLKRYPNSPMGARIERYAE